MSLAVRTSRFIVNSRKLGRQTTRFISSDVAVTDEEAYQNSVLASMEEVRRQEALVCNKPIYALIPEPKDALPAKVEECAALDCMPEKQQARTAVIRQMKKNAMSSGTLKTRGWVWHLKNEGQWTNPLTGWTSSADPMISVKLRFDTKEEAIEFSQKKGMNFEVHETPKRMRSRGTNYYAHNFLPAHLETKLRIEGKNTKYFTNPNADESHYFRPLNFHGNGEARQHGPNQKQPIS